MGASLAFASMLVACSTTYQPMRPGRIGVVIHHGAPAYVKDGRQLSIGPFSGHLEELVADVPAAAAHAGKAHTELMVGVPAYLGGLGGVVLGIVLLSGPIGWVVIGVGAAATGTGLWLMGAGVTHAVDAMNIHDDHDGDGQCPAPGGDTGRGPGNGGGNTARNASTGAVRDPLDRGPRVPCR